MEEAKIVKVAAYIRVSSQEQAMDGYGLDVQLRNIKSEVERNKDKGWVLAEKRIYSDEGVSGTIKNRPALNKMMLDIHEKQIDLVLVWKIDRLFRSISQLLNTVEEFGANNVEFKSVTESFDTTAVGRFIFQIFGVLAEFERNLMLQRTGEGKISGAMAGNYVGGGVPFGYTVADKKIVIDEKEAPHVRMIFNWFANFGWSCWQIAEELTKRQVVMEGGKSKMYRRSKNSSNFWHVKTIRRILQNKTYLGIYYYNRTGRDKHGKDFIKPEKQWVPIPCPPLTDTETFRKCQIRFEESKKHSNRAKNKYLFSTKLMCGLCGGIYTGYTSMKATKNYRCGKTNKTKIQTVCIASNISEKKLVQSLWIPIRKLLMYPKQELEQMEKEINSHHLYTQLLSEKKVIDKSIQGIGEARKRVKEAFRRGTYGDDELDEEMGLLDKDLAELQEASEGVNAQLTIAQSKKEKILSLKDIAKKYAKNLESLDYDGMYDVIQTLVNRIIIKGNDLNMELKIPKQYQNLAKSGDENGGPGWT